MKGKYPKSSRATRNKGGGMTMDNLDKPYSSRVKGLGGMQNNGSARTISGGNHRSSGRKK